MNARILPGTDLTVSDLCCGTAGFGNRIDESTAFRLLDAYVDGGGNMIDTARVYADGIGETIIGRWLSRGGRSKAIVATKGGHYDHRGPSFSRVTRSDVMTDVEISLKELKSDVIDFYWLHRDNTDLPVAEIAGFCNNLVASGKIRYWGISNWTLERAKEACALGAKAVSNRFSYAHVPSDGSADGNGLVTTDAALYDWHTESQIPLVPYSALAFGFFEKLLAANASVENDRIVLPDASAVSPGLFAALNTPENADRYEKVCRYCRETGRSATDLTIGFHRTRPFADIPVIAARTEEQLNALLSACDTHVNPAEFL
ncbi:MAG: aldo/keto reductase [Clostridia bacterium]|nr:aldo/keto reductase [Clostridia bacterium]